MTREHAKELLPIITAFANGEDVQIHTTSEQWLSMEKLNFEKPLSQYRIKPKPRKVWVIEYDDGELHMATNKDQRDNGFLDSGRIACHEIELPPLP